MDKGCVVIAESRLVVCCCLFLCSIETGREFFAKDWFSGMPYSSSNLQGTLYRLSRRSKVRKEERLRWGGGEGGREWRRRRKKGLE